MITLLCVLAVVQLAVLAVILALVLPFVISVARPMRKASEMMRPVRMPDKVEAGGK